MADNNNNNPNLFDHILAELNSENSTLETDDYDQMDQIDQNDQGFDDHDQIDQIAHGFDDQMTVAWTTSACSAARTERGGSARK